MLKNILMKCNYLILRGILFFVGGDNVQDDIDIIDDSAQETEETQEERDIIEEQQIETDFNNKDPVQKK